MPRKKKELPIAGTGRKPEDLLVQKSRPLFALWRSDLTLQEFKILDSYLARIDSHHPEKRVVIFAKGELEQLLGVTKINHPQLRERLKHLMGNVVEVGDPKQPKSMHLITLFDEAIASQDEASGLWEVRLECTQKAMKYCFNIEKLGYLRYKLRGVVGLQSRYSYVLFLYLESQRKFKSWTVSLDQLKAILKCDTEETYKEFKFFNQKILQRCSKEIFEKTDQRFTYEPIKKGRKVTAIKFTLATLSDEIEQPEQSADVIPGQIDIDDVPSSLLSEACNNEFSPTDIDELDAILRDNDIDPGQYGIEIARYHFLEKAYKAFLVAADRADKAGKPIKHRFTYFKKILESKKPFNDSKPLV